MRITGLISIFILTAVVLYGADAHKDIAPPIDTAIPSGTVRNVSMEKVLLITNGPTGTNAVPVKNTRGLLQRHRLMTRNEPEPKSSASAVRAAVTAAASSMSMATAYPTTMTYKAVSEYHIIC